MLMVKVFIQIVIAGLLLSCSSSKQSIDTQQSTLFSDEQIAKEENLSTETCLESKKARIKRLQNELENIKLQLEERQRLLQELTDIKNTLQSDSAGNAGDSGPAK
jgi:uncharacterized protein YcfL